MSKSYGPPVPPMPGFVRSALEARNLTDAFQARPKYQQDGYLVWIHEAKLNDLKRKRMTQMLDELEKGDVFKAEPWSPPPPVATK
ncbi:MAG TPA: YdeI/OmpD-associated family protein [Kofleriaceae bacterium]|nr:YdeI/OmpD-associated family protein [Kofleriaceae bacterium]